MTRNGFLFMTALGCGPIALVLMLIALGMASVLFEEVPIKEAYREVYAEAFTQEVVTPQEPIQEKTAREEHRGDAPDMSKIPLFRPYFRTSLGDVDAGTAFLAKAPLGDDVLVLSAHHLLGTAGGLNRDLTWQEVRSKVEEINCEPIQDGFQVLSSTRAVLIVGARPLNQSDGSRDLLVFRASKKLANKALPMRKDNPQPGEVVWLYASLVEGGDTLLHRATVVAANDKGLSYKFDRVIPLQATSGAPVIDKKGNLVAVNLGGNGTTGFGNPISSVRDKIKDALL